MALVGFGLILSRVVSSLRFFTLSLSFSPLLYQLNNNLFLPGTKNEVNFKGPKLLYLRERLMNFILYRVSSYKFCSFRFGLFFLLEAVQNRGSRINCWVLIKTPCKYNYILIIRLPTKN